MSERESRNSCHLSWLMKSCFPNTSAPNSIITPSSTRLFPPPQPPHQHQGAAAVTFSSLPDDIVLECISRVPPSSIPVLPQVCRRWARLVASSAFSHLRRIRGLLHSAFFALSASSDSTLFAAALRFHTHSDSPQSLIWKVSAFLPENDAVPISLFSNHARLCAVGPTIYIIGRTATLRYDIWTGSVTAMSPMLFPRKKFAAAAAAVAGKIYVAGGGGGATAVEEYDPGSDRWSVVSHAPRRRYGCIGASAGGILYVIGGMSVGGASRDGGAAHLYASSMDLFDVEASRWLRSRAVPGGGCVVAACTVGAEGEVYVLASHAVELSFWRFKLKVKGSSTIRYGGKRGGDGYGEWCRIRSPPVAVAQVSRVRYSCVGVGNKVVLVQLSSRTGDTSGSSGNRLGLVLVYNTVGGEWSAAPDLPDVITHSAACVSLEC